MSLNTDQEKALSFITRWWKGNQMYCILNGPGGVGKSYLVNEVLKTLTNCTPLLLAPTNEALKQLSDKVTGKQVFKTLHSALGITPTTGEKELQFVHRSIPTLWDDFNLAIVDEVSMIPEWMINLLIETGTRILYIGHESQLPPIDTRRGIFDKCISPVFDKGYPTVSLTIPMRNTGKLWDFNNHLEEMIYTSDRVIPDTFDVKKAELDEYLLSEQGKTDFLSGDTKVVLWSNAGVNNWNQKIRIILHGDEAKRERFIPKDKLILTSPLVAIQGLERYSASGLENVMNNKDLPYYYSNSKAEVISVEEVTVTLDFKHLTIPCYKILVCIEDSEDYLYECINPEDKVRIAEFYEHAAWAYSKREDREKAFRKRRFILSCFADILHFFSATSHRLQGSSVPNVIVVNSDIARNGNIIEQKKCRYVAASRSINNLMMYRGI